MLDAVGARGVEQQPRDVGPRIVPGGIGGVLRHPDHAEIDIGIQNAFLIGRKFLGQRTAVRPVDHRMAAAGMQERMFFGESQSSSIMACETTAQGPRKKHEPSTA